MQEDMQNAEAGHHTHAPSPPPNRAGVDALLRGTGMPSVSKGTRVGTPVHLTNTPQVVHYCLGWTKRLLVCPHVHMS
jgi:hypothetical protein